MCQEDGGKLAADVGVRTGPSPPSFSRMQYRDYSKARLKKPIDATNTVRRHRGLRQIGQLLPFLHVHSMSVVALPYHSQNFLLELTSNLMHHGQ